MLATKRTSLFGIALAQVHTPRPPDSTLWTPALDRHIAIVKGLRTWPRAIADSPQPPTKRLPGGRVEEVRKDCVRAAAGPGSRAENLFEGNSRLAELIVTAGTTDLTLPLKPERSSSTARV
jgi:hypothetical protein